jgi:soluble lytic murein transglycosylase-like protein
LAGAARAKRRRSLRGGLAAAFLVAACQTSHPLAELPSSRDPAPIVDLLPLLPLVEPAPAPVLATVPAAIDPTLSLAAPDPVAETAWIDALLMRRAPTLGTRARAALALEVSGAAEYGLDPLVVLSLIAQESRFDPGARGQHGALGLMQIRPFVARDVARRHGIPWEGQSTLLDPAHNVAIGTAYLGEILRQFGDLELALAGYNMGPTRLQRMLARGDEPKGEYVGRILSHYADLATLASALETAGGSCSGVDC